MNTSLLLNPVPFTEAADFLKSKPAVTREVFDRLLPEIKARAFTVAGLSSVDDLQTVRDAIATLPQGARWQDVKDDVIGMLVGSTEEDFIAATKHAELILRMQGFQAYSAAQDQLAQATKEDLPFLMYNSMEDDRVRPEHAALDGLVLPVDDPFWAEHTPPWDWGCRCWRTQISAAEQAKIAGGDAYGRVLGPAEDKRLHLTGELDDGAGHVITITTPQQRAEQAGEDPAKAWHWNPGDLRIPLDTLKARYADDPETWNVFVNFAKTMSVDELHNISTADATLWGWLLDGNLQTLALSALKIGEKEEREAAFALNLATGKNLGPVKGGADYVAVADLLGQLYNEGDQWAILHNHPSGGTLSFNDILRLLESAQTRMMVAATPKGQYYFRAGDRLFAIMQSESYREKLIAAVTKKYNSWLGDDQSLKLRWLAEYIGGEYGFVPKA